MRNLKRALSMALAAIMVLGLMVVGASATSYEDFTDKDEIVNKEAVNTMVSLGVISGKEDGSYYAPADSLTRAEACTLIARMLGGGKDPVLGSNIKSNFTDTQGHWAETYIAYCANLGIIVGVGDGSFNPDGTLTGTAAAKMVLCALGYKPEFEGIGGANWELATNTLATKVKLYDGLEDLNPSETISRDDVAQLLYNGVQADEVEYRNLEGDYSGTLYAQPVNGTDVDAEPSTMLHNRFLVDKVEGIVVATDLMALEDSSSNTTTTVEGKTRLDYISVNGTDYEDSLGNPIPAIYPVDIDDELLGQKVVLYVQGLKDLAPNASSTKVIGEPIVSMDNTVVTTTGRLKNTTAVKDALKGSGVAMGTTLPRTLTVTDGTTSWTPANGVQFMPGVTQKFIDNNADGVVDVLIQENPALAKINTYNENSKEMNISGIGTVDFVDVYNPEDVAQGDYVLVYNYDSTYVLTVAESVSGTVTTYTNNAADPELGTVTIDGTKYGRGSGKMLAPDLLDLGSVADIDNSGSTADNNAATVIAEGLKEMLDNTYTLYLDPNGNILGYVEDDSAIGNYAIITGINATGSESFRSVEVKLLMADGTIGKYDVNLVASAKKWDTENTGVNTGSNSDKEEQMYNVLDTLADNYLVTYTLDGSTVTLGRPEQYNADRYDRDTTTNDLAIRSGKSSYVFDNGTVMADDKTVFFIEDVDGDTTAVVGLSNLRDNELNTYAGSTSTVIAYTSAGSNVLEARAIFTKVDEDYSSNSSYAFVTGNYDKNTSGTNTLYTYPVVFEDGEVGTLTSKSDADVDKSKVHEYQADGEYVTFDNDTEFVRNTLIVTSVGSNAISVAKASNPTVDVASYATRNATVWNVEDTNNVFKTSFQKNDLVALVLDDDDNVVTGFVYDRQDDNVTPSLTEITSGSNGLNLSGLTATNVEDGGDIDDGGYTVNGGAVTFTNVTSGDAIALNLKLGSTQKATVKVEKDGINGTCTTGSTNYTVGTNINQNIFTGTAAQENGGKITVTITVTDTSTTTSLASRTIVYEITLTAAEVDASTLPAMDADVDDTYVDGTLTPGTIANDDVTLADDSAWTLSNAVTGQDVTMKFASLSGLTATITAVNGDETDALVGTTFADSTPETIYTVTGAEAAGTKITVTVEFSDGTSIPAEKTYTVTINPAVKYTLSVPGMARKEYYAGESITLTTAQWSSITGTGWVKVGPEADDFAQISSGNLTFTMPASDLTLSADSIGYYEVTYKTGPEAGDQTVSYLKSYNDLTLTAGVAYVAIGSVKTDVTSMGTLNNDVTVIDMYAVTVTGNGTDKVAGTTVTGDITASDYIAVGDTVTITADSSREAKAAGTTGVTISDGATNFTMPANNVTIVFDAQ